MQMMKTMQLDGFEPDLLNVKRQWPVDMLPFTRIRKLGLVENFQLLSEKKASDPTSFLLKAIELSEIGLLQVTRIWCRESQARPHGSSSF